MSRPNDTRGADSAKDLAAELARALASPTGARTVRLLQMAGLTTPTTTAASSSAGVGSISAAQVLADLGNATLPRAISIWQPLEGEVLTFERPPRSPLGDHYAATPVLRAEKPPGCRRVIWLGESAAAGYLYAPHVTPAAMLGERLGPAFEVVDLARTNERLESLVRTAARSLQLAPDVLVVFAGNNWTLLETPDASPFAPSTRARQRLARTVRQGGLLAAVADAQRQLGQRVDAAIEALAALAAHAQIPILWLVPEVNARDWDAHQPVHQLPGDGVARWYTGRDEARAALREDRLADALAAAETMLKLDQGLGPTGHRLRARALEGLGRLGEAAGAWQAAVDATSAPGQCFLAAPQASSWVRDRIRSAARANDQGLVDLPAIFAAKTGWTVPDRRLFLDYCHLNGVGMRLAAEAVASEVCRQLGSPPAKGTVSPIPAAVEATARLGAALHTAHRLAPVDRAGFRTTIRAWCQEALDVSRADAVAAMAAVASARTGGLPAVLDVAQAKQLACVAPLQIQHGWRWPHLDPDVLDALGLVDGQRLVAHLGVGRSAVELVRAPYLWSPVERVVPAAIDADPPAFLRAAAPRTRFALVTDGGHDLMVTVIARRAGGGEQPPASLDLYLSGVGAQVDSDERILVGTMPLDGTWTRHRFRVSGARLRFGCHCLTLQWPMLAPIAEPLAEAITRLEAGQEASLHPIFGELFSLRAQRA